MYSQRSRVAESLEVHLILTSSLSAMSNDCLSSRHSQVFYQKAPVINLDFSYFRESLAKVVFVRILQIWVVP